MNFIERIGKSKKQLVQYKALNPNFTPKILEVKQNSNTESTTLYGDKNPKPSLLNRKTKFNWKTNFKTNSFPFKLYSFFEKSLTYTNYTLKFNQSSACGEFEPSRRFETKYGLVFSNVLVQAHTIKNLFLFVINIMDAPVHLKAGVKIGEFTVLTAEQASYLIPLEPELLKNYTKRKQQLILNSIEMKNKYNQPSDTQVNKFWFSTLETWKDPEKLDGLKKRI